MNKEILKQEVQDFLKVHAKENAKDIALKKSPFIGVSSSELATQFESRQKAEKKLPLWFGTEGIYYPLSLSIEQASSEETALYKASLIQENSSLVDLTGGIGIDSYYFSKRAKKVVHCEINPELSEIAKHNAEVLGSKNIKFVKGNGVEFLIKQAKGEFQTIYLDPSRRVNTKKVFMLQDCEPDVVDLQDELMEKASTILIKTAPLLDISLALAELKHVREVHVISLKNECKEVLFLLEKDFKDAPLIRVVGLGKDAGFEFNYLVKQEKQAVASYSSPKQYLYDPDAGLLKAGCFKLLSQHYAVQKLHPSTHLYTSEDLLPSFPGRSFEIEEVYEYKDFKKIKRNWNANVIAKNFPLKVEEIRKRHKIREGDRGYLFFCKTEGEKLSVVYANRLA
jgi:16S rRNA G966 N2-methylase RsmD